MGVKQLLKIWLAGLRGHPGLRAAKLGRRHPGHRRRRSLAGHGRGRGARRKARKAARAVPELADFISGPAPRSLTVETRLAWEGADLDGDGQPDVANPTGQAPRQTDAYGDGRFHASRDGGAREHEGVDYVATAGQTVVAPISGYVSKIGYAYPDDQSLRFVEIDNPALRLTARVLYVDPSVAVGDTVAVGRPIGQAVSLQNRYRHGITNHVHLEIVERGRKIDAATLIVARAETGPILADWPVTGVASRLGGRRLRRAFAAQRDVDRAADRRQALHGPGADPEIRGEAQRRPGRRPGPPAPRAPPSSWTQSRRVAPCRPS